MKPVSKSLFVRLHTVLAVGLLLGCSGSPTGPSEPGTIASRTFLSFNSDPDEWVGVGQTRHYGLDDGVWQVTFFPDSKGRQEISIIVEAPPTSSSYWYWQANFGAPTGVPMRTGSYDDAAGFPTSENQSVLQFFGNYRACVASVGTFNILELQRSATTIERFHVVFEQRCTPTPAVLRGEIVVVPNPVGHR